MNKLFDDGYIVVDTTELIKDPDALMLVKHSARELSDPSNREKHFKYRLNFAGVPYSNDSHIQPSEVKRKLSDAKTKGLEVIQQWYETCEYGNFRPMFEYMAETIEQYAAKIYTVSPSKFIHAQVNLTVYEDGDFIDPHRDGKNEGRLAIFLIYMTEPEKYNDGGGKLIIKDDTLHDEIEPLFGKFVILDFTKNNVNHAVEPVKNGFRRTCFLAIVTERDK